MEMMPAGSSHVVIVRANVKKVFTQKVTVGIFKSNINADVVAIGEWIDNIVIEVNANGVAACRGGAEGEIITTDIIAAGRIYTAIGGHQGTVSAINAGAIAHILKAVGTAGIIRTAGIPICSAVFKTGIERSKNIISFSMQGCERHRRCQGHHRNSPRP